tara:strand:+ start:39566 stop:39673 length:108 start_codon:yes stop_codon:yes gene_type:complete
MIRMKKMNEAEKCFMKIGGGYSPPLFWKLESNSKI